MCRCVEVLFQMSRPSTLALGPGRGLRAALVAMTLGVALLVPAVTNAAAPAKWTATAQFQFGNGSCGADQPALPILGDVSVTKRAQTIELHVVLDGSPAAANTTYELYLYTGGCSQLADMGPVTTDAFGVADVTRHVKTGTVTTFFATLWGPNGWNDTTIFPAP
jgi:hypothetical protein